VRALPPVPVPDAEAMRAHGEATAALLRGGDLVVLVGPLGAGKTTWVQGLARGLGVRGPITSPTFVIARSHPSLVGGPALVHADAYRISGAVEFDDLGLEESAEGSVTVVEWGEGVADSLGPDRLVVRIDRTGDDDARTVSVEGQGPRWADPRVEG